ncbi:transcriptional regulator [Tardiphaga robiniae]|uniref:Transcriptional regulator n=2 Tax=Tardiphaga robiniae TaxID=943830 RepID=A0A161QNV2_9BRAD|nr:transcriptional regulator [Tardiphaga robiniae]
MNNRALKLVRQYHRMSQVGLAEKLELSKSFISELEAGNRRPSIDVLEKYAEHFKLPLSSLMLFSEQLDSKDWHARSRDFVAAKVMNMLEWLEETSAEEASEKRA